MKFLKVLKITFNDWLISWLDRVAWARGLLPMHIETGIFSDCDENQWKIANHFDYKIIPNQRIYQNFI